MSHDICQSIHDFRRTVDRDSDCVAFVHATKAKTVYLSGHSVCATASEDQRAALATTALVTLVVTLFGGCLCGRRFVEATR